MAASPQFKVFHNEEYIAAFKDHLEAIRYVQVLGYMSYSVRVGHAKKNTFWNYVPGDVSWDEADETAAQRLVDMGLAYMLPEGS